MIAARVMPKLVAINVHRAIGASSHDLSTSMTGRGLRSIVKSFRRIKTYPVEMPVNKS